MPRINDGYGGNYYQPPKKTTTPKPTAPKPAAPKTAVNYYNWEERSYWQKKQQAEYIKQMEAELMRQWAQSEVSIAQQTFTDMPSQVGKYTYKQPFQYQINESPLIRQLMAANPRSVVLEGLMRTGYSIPKYLQAAYPTKQTAQTLTAPARQTYGGQNVRRWWTGTMEKYGPTAFALNVNERPIQPYTGPGWQPAYLPDYTFPDFGFGGGGGSYDYTSNPFYRNAEATRKPTYYETYLTWRVK